MNFKFINLTLFLNLLLLLTSTKASIASNFFLTPEETIIKSFSEPLKAEGNWERFSFELTTLNVNDGDINVYWQDDIPQNPSTERDKYSVAFRYAENDSVCWNGRDVRDSNNILAKVGGSCPNSHRQEVKEDAEIKTFVRPKSYYTLHQDQGFGGIDPIGTGLVFSGNNVDTYKMTLSLLDQDTIAASTFFLSSGTWQEMSVFDLNSNQKDLLGVEQTSSTLPLPIAYSNELATIEGIDIQFRRPGTGIKELLVSQATPKSVPEGSNLFSLLNVGLLGLGLAIKSINKQI